MDFDHSLRPHVPEMARIFQIDSDLNFKMIVATRVKVGKEEGKKEKCIYGDVLECFRVLGTRALYSIRHYE